MAIAIILIEYNFICLWSVRSLYFGKEKEIGRRERRFLLNWVGTIKEIMTYVKYYKLVE
jgi:hypothetical protein